MEALHSPWPIDSKYKAQVRGLLRLYGIPAMHRQAAKRLQRQYAPRSSNQPSANTHRGGSSRPTGTHRIDPRAYMDGSDTITSVPSPMAPPNPPPRTVMNNSELLPDEAPRRITNHKATTTGHSASRVAPPRVSEGHLIGGTPRGVHPNTNVKPVSRDPAVVKNPRSTEECTCPSVATSTTTSPAPLNSANARGPPSWANLMGFHLSYSQADAQGSRKT